MLPEKITHKILFEIDEIDNQLNSYQTLIEICKLRKPDLIEITAMSSVLQSFYTGIENIFITIAKEIDKTIPSSQKWHKQLLNQMLTKNSDRNSVIGSDLFEILQEYLGFRHFCRHSYSYHLDWEQVKPLAEKINENWEKIKKQIKGIL